MCDCLETLRRHTASHVMSAAVKMIWPEALRGVGPWTDTGFYQDFDFLGETVSEKDFKKIEKKMRWIINKDFKVVSQIITPEEARAEFGYDKYKMELIEEFVARGDELSVYDFVAEDGRVTYRDLCAGPHLESTGKVGVVKLMKIAGSYWRGDENRENLTRIYGVAFETKQQLEDYEKFLEEAAKRDHRKIGKELGLFTFSDLVGSGLPLFTPKGAFIRNKIEETIMDFQTPFGFEKVHIPHITKKDLYETSGHWQKYKDDLFHVKGKGDTEFVMKPMNCPHHAQIFASEMRSYRDLPIRYAETTTCYRDEQPGELLGLSRVRSLTQDDGHVFCRIAQVGQEAENLVEVIKSFYTKLGMFNEGDFWVSLSVRDPEKPEKYMGDPADWDKAEAFLESVAQNKNLPFKRVEGEAAFYGPKLDFQFKDALGREWQLATIQIDFVQPKNFGLEYTNEQGEKEQPVMIHRAIAGSLERFMSVIIEHFAGAFPAWLAPVQAHIIPVNQAHEDFAYDLAKKLKQQGARTEVYDSTNSLGKRVRNCQTGKIPFAIIIGDKEMESGNLTIRKYGEQKDTVVSINEFLELLK
ncbi:threonine--tRNA ligase [bacterium DOLZORAL124_38_8]|nr:MAG: threonine--tRNA ligase [bacterium DOLZORAL124_38_8]